MFFFSLYDMHTYAYIRVFYVSSLQFEKGVVL